MKRFFTSLATFSLVETIGRHPAMAAGILTLLGVGGGATAIAMLTPPTIIPFVSSNFNPNQSIGTTNNGLKLNGGTAGSTQFPPTATNSFANYFEMVVNPSLAYSQSVEVPFIGGVLNTNTLPGQPNFFYQRLYLGLTNVQWLLNPGASVEVGGSATTGSNYASGFYPFTVPNSGCARAPTGVWMGGTTQFQQVDPGFGCPAATLSLNAAAIAANVPGSAAQQATGLAASPAQSATTCVSNSPVSGEMTVTVHLATAHEVTPGITYPLQGFNGTGFTGYNATYTALPGTTGSTLVGETTTGGGTCPTSPLDTSAHEGTALSGTGAAITFPAVSTTNPFGQGSTGITVSGGQHICGFLGEYGDDSSFPGAQFISMVDNNGNAVPGSPALVTLLNQGIGNVTGYVTTGAQPALTVTALNAYTITGATFNAMTGFATFTVSSNPGFVPGSEFTVSGLSSTGPGSFNLTYVAVSGTTSSSIVANPLSGPGGTPQGSSLPGSSTYASGGQMVSVLLPGAQIFGASTGAVIMPYGTASSSGTGGTGTYALSANQAGYAFTVSAVSGTTITVTGAPAQYIIPGTTFVLNSNTYTITGLGTGTGQAGTYTVNTSTGLATGTATATGAIGSSGSPVTIADYSLFYYNPAAASTPSGITVTPRTGSSIGDFIPVLGAGNTTVSGAVRTSWGGALGNFATLYGALPSQAGGAPSTSDLASICTKQTDIQAYAAAKSLKVNSLYRLNDPGIWGDSGDATITGYITNSSGTNATLNVVSTPYGSLGVTPSQPTANLTGVGLPVASPVTIPLTAAAGTTYAITPNTTAALGSSGSPVTFAVGAFKPALPIQSNTLKGYIDTTAGVSTLHVTSLDDGTAHSGFASFTGSLTSSFSASIASGTNQLVVTAPTSGNPVIGLGSSVSIPGGTPSTATVIGVGTASGLSGTYTLSATVTGAASSETMYGYGALPAPPTTLIVSGVTGELQQGMAVTDGGASLTGSPLLITGGSGTTWTVAGNYYQGFLADSTMTASLTTLVPGEYIQNAAITNPVKVVAYGSGAIGGVGHYTLSGSPNSTNAVGSSGSPVVLTGTTITDGGAIAPGPALTISDLGPAITFPLTNVSANTGTLRFTGTYSTGTLGGTPSGIQVLVSNSANGPPLAGCTPCNWGALTASISGGAWSGTIAGIPGGGPYFVSVRAANGTAYATLPNSIKVGFVYALYGQGQADSMQGAQSGSYTSYFSGLWGFAGWTSSFSSLEHYMQGPPITANFVPGEAFADAGDRFGVQSGGAPLSEAVSAFDQELTNAFGVPASFLSATRDGVGIGLVTLGNAVQTQTIGAGNGSTLIWCSASTFCPSAGVSPAGPLVFGAASLTGGWFTGSVSGSTLTATTRIGGALEPGMVLSTPNAPTLVMCLTGCSSGMAFGGSTWLLSSAADSGATGAMRADPVGGAPWPNLNIQVNGASVYAWAGFGWSLVKPGTFTVSVNGAVVCQDTGVFAYNNTGGNCIGAGVSGFVNYQTGDYQINFTTAPPSNAAIVASWTNIVSPETISSASLNKPQNIDFFGDGTCQSGADSALFCKAPGGVNGHIYSGEGTDKTYMMNSGAAVNQGYQFGGLGYSQMISWLYGTKFPALVPGASPSVPFITTGQWRIEGPQEFTNPVLALDGVHDQWTQDIATKSTFSGTVTSSVLTLTANAVGPMWEGEVVGCAPVMTNCGIRPLSGVYITSLASGAWGASGSTYNLAGSPPNVATAAAMQNPVYYSGSGPAFYAGTLNDVIVQSQGLSGTTGRNPHTSNGFTGGRRATSRWAAMIYGANGGNATDPKVDRVKADAVGCDTAALAAPCFDIGTTYQSSFATATWSGNTVTIPGGLAAHALPFVVGQAFSCSGCNSNLVITSLSVPPTESTAIGAGEVGQIFTFTANNASGQAIGGSGSGAVAGGCSGTSGTGSNCIDVAIAINVNGTFGASAAIDTCGAGNLNGNAPNYAVPNGKCQGNGIGEIVRAFRIGTNQLMYGNGSIVVSPGSVFDDGVDMANGAFNQSVAFTCNIVAAKVARCVKAPAYSGGALTGVGQWGSGATYISYGDLTIVTGRIASLLGYVGGQSFPFTAGSGYTNGTYSGIAAICTTIQSGGTAPRFDVIVTGGSIVDVYPSSQTTGNSPAGLGVGSTCTVPLTTVTCTGGSCGGTIATIPLAPVEGFGGIGTYNTDSNTMGMFLYDNSGEPGNPLNQFFTNGQGGYFEPGLPLRPFGLFQGVVVSG
jgi:hypothetical protein